MEKLVPIGEADPKLIKKAEEFIKEKKWSWRQLADAIKYPASTISLWRAGKYRGNNTDINIAVERFLRIESKKQADRDLNYVETRNNRRAFGVFETCHADGVIGLIIGDTGTSKTTSIREYARHNEVILIEANRTYRSPNEYLRKIHQHKKVGKDGRGSLNQLYTDICNELRGTNTLIIVDQADYLNLSAIDVFRAISDEAGIGVVFVGLPSFLRKIRGNEPEVRQVRDRIRVKIELGAYSKDECENILEANWKEGKSIADEFYRLSAGSLRILSSLVYNARRIMANPANQGKPIDSHLLEKSAAYLEIRVA